MNVTTTCLVPLQQASLCIDCETITAAHTTCLACGSRALLNIATVLNNRRPAGPAREDGSSVLQMSLQRPRQRIVSRRAELGLDRALGRRKIHSAASASAMPDNTA
jgi:hypothetical protein